MFARITIAARLGLGFGLLLLLLVVAVALGLDRISTLNDRLDHVVARDWENAVLANRVIDLMNAQTRDTLLLFHDPERDVLRERISRRVHTIGILIDQLESRLDNVESRALLEAIREQRKGYVASFGAVSELHAQGRDEEASRMLLAETVPHLDGLLASIGTLIEVQGRILRETAAESLETFERARASLMLFLGAAMLVALILSAWIIRGVLRPLGGEPETARRVVETIAQGDLDGRVPVRPGDRDSLLAAMQTMQTNLRRLIDERMRAENALRDSQQRFQSLVETLGDWVWEVDGDWRYTYASPQVREILGYAPEDVLGKTPFDLMPPEEAGRVHALAEVARARRLPLVGIENVNLHKSGRRVILESSGQPYFDSEGRFLGYRGVDREITDRKEAEASRMAEAARLRDALVREVHHRIKNNLQTVVSLLRREASKRSDASDAIEAAIAQVQAVAVVHGLYGRVTRHSVLLCELLPAVVGTVSELTGVAIHIENHLEDDGKLLIRESETVAVALVLNEIVTNAVKHASGDSPASVPSVKLTRDGERGRILIENPGALAPGFDFNSRQGLGTGLGLVRALIPVPGMSVSFRQTGDRVEVEIVIESPVVGSTDDKSRSVDTTSALPLTDAS
ncbi:MAG TPA: PAS domain S-box protein [Rhodocyclaceae bacterium]|nr:PAS domain S-box protein [Rhodocyclaceae bacterium]HRQ46194.1 PAS domain S-box protein [Rhodocyclaceae bacterium]